MYDPNDDTDVTSGTTDGAQMERTSPPVRLRADTATGGLFEGGNGLRGCFAMFYVTQTTSLTAFKFRRCRTCELWRLRF